MNREEIIAEVKSRKKIFYWSEKDHVWICETPEISAGGTDGKTLEEMIKNQLEVEQMHIEQALDEGSVRKSVEVIKLSTDYFDFNFSDLERIAEKQGVEVDLLISQILKKYLNSNA